MLQHFCISGRTNLTHTYVCFVMYTDNFHHKFLYHIWYNENPYPLTPYLNTNKQYNISLQNRTDWCVIPVGTALTLLPTARCVEISVKTVIAKPGCYWQLHVSAFRWPSSGCSLWSRINTICKIEWLGVEISCTLTLLCTNRHYIRWIYGGWVLQRLVRIGCFPVVDCLSSRSKWVGRGGNFAALSDIFWFE